MGHLFTDAPPPPIHCHVLRKRLSCSTTSATQDVLHIPPRRIMTQCRFLMLIDPKQKASYRHGILEHCLRIQKFEIW